MMSKKKDNFALYFQLFLYVHKKKKQPKTVYYDNESNVTDILQ